jgi:hypothetical protein
MGRRVDVDAWGDLHFIANPDAIAVEQETVIVNERPVPDEDVVAIVAPERRFEHRSLTNPSEQLRQQKVPFIVGIRGARVELGKDGLGSEVVGTKLGATGHVELACQHLRF